jgi:4-hydroxybenzoate polyprenyltransferase
VVVRIWLKDSERRPDPSPVKTDDRKAMLVGIALWLAATAVLFFFIGPLTESGNAWWLWTCIAALGLGLLGLIYTHWKRRRDDAAND